MKDSIPTPDRTSVLPMGVCCICYEECRVGAPPVACTCRWEVCEPCFADWVKTSDGKCIICRADLRPIPPVMPCLKISFRNIIDDILYCVMSNIWSWVVFRDFGDWVDITSPPVHLVCSFVLTWFAEIEFEFSRTYLVPRVPTPGHPGFWGKFPGLFFMHILWHIICKNFGGGPFDPRDIIGAGVFVFLCSVTLRWIRVHRRYGLAFPSDNVE